MTDDPFDSSLEATGHYSEAALERVRNLIHAVPDQIGPYRILERIGGGGMGEVYRAEQRSPIRREVALKFIKLGMDTKSVIARFEAERQALALMDHPHIAKVLDAGADEMGRPYFVMEYVKGQPITEYADRNQLTIAERLELVEQVCQAIQHAHHKGVIHRDLKPTNVLVSTHDGKPFAKVIDFGIAKAIGQQLTDKTLFTLHSEFIGTPQYMSPEQAEGSLDIDTRTDVYSLGVLLYELLTGTPPFSATEFKQAAWDQFRKQIIEVDPPKPSTRLSESGPALSTLATSRRTEPKRLGPLVRGELDWIVMKALEKDRKRRYETPTNLASDLHAHLVGSPIQAAPPSSLYQLRKLIVRHRGPATFFASLGFLLLIALGATTWGYFWAIQLAESENTAKRQAEQSREASLAAEATALQAKSQALKALREAENARQREAEHAHRARNNERDAVAAAEAAQRAEKRATELATIARENERKALVAVASVQHSRDANQAIELEASAILDFVEKRILNDEYPIGKQDGPHDEVTLRQAILSAIPHMNQALLNQPATQARLHSTFGTALDRLGEERGAEQQFALAFNLNANLLGLEDQKTIQSMIRSGMALLNIGRIDDARLLCEKAVEIIEDNATYPSAINWDCRTLQAQVSMATGDFKTAILLLENVIREQGQHSPEPVEELMQATSCLADALAGDRQEDAALKLREQNSDRARRFYGAGHPGTFAALNALATSYQSLGREEDASRIKKEVSASQLKRENSKSDIIADDSLAVVTLHALHRNWKEVIRIRERDLSVARKEFGDKHHSVADMMEMLGVTHAWAGNNEQAISIYKDALSLSKDINGDADSRTLSIRRNLAIVLYAVGRHEDASSLAEETMRLGEEQFGRTHYVVPESLHIMAMALIHHNRDLEAIPLLDKAIEICQTTPAHRDRLGISVSLRFDCFGRRQDVDGMRATAALWDESQPTAADSLYRSARMHGEILNLISSTIPAGFPAMDAEAGKSLAALDQAIRNGYRLTAEEVVGDQAFSSLIGYPEFERIVSQLRLQALVAQRRQLEELKIRLGPSHPETVKTWRALIGVALDQQLREDSLRDSQELLANVRANPELATELAPTLQLAAQVAAKFGLFEEAATHYGEAVGLLNAQNESKGLVAIQCRMDWAFALARAGRKAEAIASARDTVKIVGEGELAGGTLELSMRERMVDVLLEAGEPNDALAELSQLCAKWPNEALLVLRAAILHAWLEQLDELQELREAALKTAEITNIPEVAERLSKACTFYHNPDRDQLERARNCARRAIELNPRHAYILFFHLALGMAEYRLGNYEDAIVSLQRANPSGVVGREWLHITAAFFQAMAAQRLGRHQQAIEWQNQALGLMPPPPGTDENPLRSGSYDTMFAWIISRECAAMISSSSPPVANPNE